jgi:excisionase family DNA binding protein
MAQTQLVVIPLGELEAVVDKVVRRALGEARPADQPDEVLGREEAAELLKISLPTLRQLEVEGRINAIRYPGNRRVYYLRRELLASLAALAQGQQKKPRR